MKKTSNQMAVGSSSATETEKKSATAPGNPLLPPMLPSFSLLDVVRRDRHALDLPDIPDRHVYRIGNGRAEEQAALAMTDAVCQHAHPRPPFDWINDWRRFLRAFISDEIFEPLEAAEVRRKALCWINRSNPQYERFVEAISVKLGAAFPDVRRIETGLTPNLSMPEVYHPTEPSERRMVLQLSPRTRFTIVGKASCTFCPLGERSVELSEILVEKPLRRRGIGKQILTLCKEITRSLDTRLLLYPAVPTTISDKIENSTRYIRDLVRYYERIGFMRTHPEMAEMETMQHTRKVLGIHGLMAYR